MAERRKPPQDPGEDAAGTSRRDFLLGSVGGAVALGLALQPAGRARAQDGPATKLQVLTQPESATYAAWCDTLVPGAAEAGVSRYLDQQLAVPRVDTLLLLRVLGNPPFAEFYRSGLRGVEAESQRHHGQAFPNLDAKSRNALVEAAAAGKTEAWKNPDPTFFTFISRADAVDVVFGTERGFGELGIPHLAHIRPTAPW